MSRGPHKGSGEGALVSHRCHLQMLDLINEYLGSENRGLLMESQFGFLFPFPNLQFQGQIFNILLRHLDKTSLQRNRLEFVLGGQRLEFTPYDFALITGMRFSGWFKPPLESETHRMLFKGKQSISVDDIASRFKAECQEFGGRTRNALRLACLLIVYGIFVTMGGSVNHVDLTLFHLIDDVASFLRYPWGLIAYNSLVKRTHRARDVQERHIAKDKKLTFDANSFVLALQVWVYEVIPTVGRNCAIKDPSTAHLHPRVRRWASKYAVKYDVLHAYFSSLTSASLTPMVPAEVEEDFLKPLGFERLEAKTDGGELHLVNSKSHSSNDATKVGNLENDKLSQVMSRMEMLEKYVHSLETQIAAIGTSTVEMKNNKRDISKTGNRKINVPKKLKISIPSTVPHCKRTGLRSQSLVSVVASTNVHDLRRLKKGKSIAEDCVNSFEKVSAERTSTDVDVKKVILYDPNEMSLDPGVSKGFDAWRALSKKDSSIVLKIPCSMVGDVSSSWFDSMLRRRGWLNTSHMNALLNLLMLQSKNDPQLFGSGWSALETYCWDVLIGTNLSMVMERVGPYVSGDRPNNNPIPWAVASEIYGVGNVEGNHWLSYKIALDERCITVFDSKSSSSRWEPLKKIFSVVCKNVEHLCDGFEVFKGRVTNNDNKWKVVLFKHPPQQHGTFDCGIMAMKFIECLISGNSVGIIDSTRCGFFRRSYCAKLFHVSDLSG